MYSSKTKGTIRKAFEYVLTVIYSDQMRGKTDQEYTPSYFHNIYKENDELYDNDQISESSFKKVVPIIGYYGLLIKIGNKYLLNNKLQFKKSDEFHSFSDKIKTIATIVSSSFDEDEYTEKMLKTGEVPEGFEPSDVKRSLKRLIETSHFISTIPQKNNISKSIIGAILHSDMNFVFNNRLSILLSLAVTQTPCYIKIQLDETIIELSNAIVFSVIFDENSIIIKSSINVPINDLNNIKRISVYDDEYSLKSDIKETLSILPDYPELKELHNSLEEVLS